MKKHWTPERNGNYLSSPRMKIQLSGYVIRYNPTPEPPRDEQGRPTAFSLTFPALVLTSWVSGGEKIAAQIAQQLNTYPALLDALKALAIESGGKAIPNMSLTAAREQALAIIAAAEAEPEALT